MTRPSTRALNHGTYSPILISDKGWCIVENGEPPREIITEGHKTREIALRWLDKYLLGEETSRL